MPELPEVETTARGIAPHITDTTIRAVTIRERRLRQPVTRGFAIKVIDQRIERVTRRAKYILLGLQHGSIIVHLGMSGSLRITKPDTPAEKHDHIDLIVQRKSGELCLPSLSRSTAFRPLYLYSRGSAPSSAVNLSGTGTLRRGIRCGLFVSGIARPARCDQESDYGLENCDGRWKYLCERGIVSRAHTSATSGRENFESALRTPRARHSNGCYPKQSPTAVQPYETLFRRPVNRGISATS